MTHGFVQGALNARLKTIVRLLRRFPRVRTEFTYLGEAVGSSDDWNPTSHEARQLHTHAKVCLAVHTRQPKDRCLVMEVVFSTQVC